MFCDAFEGEAARGAQLALHELSLERLAARGGFHREAIELVRRELTPETPVRGRQGWATDPAFQGLLDEPEFRALLPGA